MKKMIAILSALALSGCLTTAQVQSYTQAINATTNLVKQIGHDVVAFDCANASLALVIAKDAGAQSRVVEALTRNAQIARDACPTLTGNAYVNVVVGAP